MPGAAHRSRTSPRVFEVESSPVCLFLVRLILTFSSSPVTLLLSSRDTCESSPPCTGSQGYSVAHPPCTLSPSSLPPPRAPSWTLTARRRWCPRLGLRPCKVPDCGFLGHCNIASGRHVLALDHGLSEQGSWEAGTARPCLCICGAATRKVSLSSLSVFPITI